MSTNNGNISPLAADISIAQFLVLKLRQWTGKGDNTGGTTSPAGAMLPSSSSINTGKDVEEQHDPQPPQHGTTPTRDSTTGSDNSDTNFMEKTNNDTNADVHNAKSMPLQKQPRNATVPLWRFLGDIVLLSYAELKAISLTLAEITALAFTIASIARDSASIVRCGYYGDEWYMSRSTCEVDCQYSCVAETRSLAFCYWTTRAAMLVFTTAKAMCTGTTSRPLSAPLAYSVQAQDTWGAWLQLVQLMSQTILAIVAGAQVAILTASSGILVVNCVAFAITSLACFVTVQAAQFGLLGIAQVYVGVMFAATQLLNDAAFASLGGSGAGVAVTVIQVFLNVYELARQTTGGYITYFDKVAYIRASDVTTLRKVRDLAYLNWTDCCDRVVFYTAPLRQTVDVTAHINQLMEELRTGPITGGIWFAAAGGTNDTRPQLQARLLFLPMIEAQLAGRSDPGKFIYTIKGDRFVAQTNGTIIRPTDDTPRTRLNTSWWLH